MWDKVKTVRVDQTGREIVEWWPGADFNVVAARMIEEYPHGMLEIKLV